MNANEHLVLLVDNKGVITVRPMDEKISLDTIKSNLKKKDQLKFYPIVATINHAAIIAIYAVKYGMNTEIYGKDELIDACVGILADPHTTIDNIFNEFDIEDYDDDDEDESDYELPIQLFNNTYSLPLLLESLKSLDGDYDEKWINFMYIDESDLISEFSEDDDDDEDNPMNLANLLDSMDDADFAMYATPKKVGNQVSQLTEALNLEGICIRTPKLITQIEKWIANGYTKINFDNYNTDNHNIQLFLKLMK